MASRTTSDSSGIKSSALGIVSAGREQQGECEERN
jgi:hypothetical protein